MFFRDSKFDKLVDQMFEGFGKNNFFEATTTTYSEENPKTFGLLSKGANCLHLGLPGHNKETVSISFENKVLTIKSKEVKLPTMAKKFKYQYSISGNLDPKNINAAFVDGVLSIKLKFDEDVSPSHEIEIQ